MSPFFTQYRVCIIVNQHLSKWCKALITNSQKEKKRKKEKSANVKISQGIPYFPKMF